MFLYSGILKLKLLFSFYESYLALILLTGLREVKSFISIEQNLLGLRLFPKPRIGGGAVFGILESHILRYYSIPYNDRFLLHGV